MLVAIVLGVSGLSRFRWIRFTFEAVPIVTARRFCVEWALAWEAKAGARAPNGELPFPGNAIEWESWRRPQADLLLRADLLDPVRWVNVPCRPRWSGRLALQQMSNLASAAKTRISWWARPSRHGRLCRHPVRFSHMGRSRAYGTWEAPRPRRTKRVSRRTPRPDGQLRLGGALSGRSAARCTRVGRRPSLLPHPHPIPLRLPPLLARTWTRKNVLVLSTFRFHAIGVWTPKTVGRASRAYRNINTSIFVYENAIVLKSLLRYLSELDL